MKQILVADDDRILRAFVSRLLKKQKYGVTVAADGQAALAIMKKKKFDLVLLDLWMPKMNGFEVLALVRQQPRTPRVVVMTSDETPEAMLRAVKEQAYRYIRKPVDPQMLLEVVEDALEERPEAPPIEVLSAKPTWVELLVPCDLDCARRIQLFLEQLKLEIPQEARDRVGQAFRELLTNAVEWGGKLDPNRKVRVAFVRTPRMLIYRIADPGPGFKFEGLTHAAVGYEGDDPTVHMEEREKKGLRPGGLGIFMTRELVDDLVYNEAQNEVLFVKYLQ
ncbi:MAG TPA: response regulator [Candidatus Acidoferrales bacterium]|nr:response regulator [Candidatus Acidoferrales bacterium]